jgi:[acyl-carrier-protein] S-malonyltransferase
MPKCLLFPGQGSQALGMGAEQLIKCPEIAEKIWDFCGTDIKEIVYANKNENNEELLNRTENAQPAIVAVSLIEALATLNTDNEAIAVGHSLGEYAMFAAAGMITPEELFALVNCRAEAMQKCCEKNPGAMYAVIGGDEQNLRHIVNYNSDAQVVIAVPEHSDYDISSISAKRVVKLAVAGAFHTELMAEAAETVRSFAEKLGWQQPQFPIWSNVTGRQFTEEEITNMPEYVAKHMISPVLFREEIRDIRKKYPDIEFADMYGKTLSGFTNKIK